MAFRVTKEHPAHFEAEGAKGKFKIAKAGLSKGRVAQFQALCSGGEVQRFAKGGEVEPKPRGVDLSKHKLLAESDTHWHIQGPGGPFKVAKKGLGKGLAEKITQHFAEGGEAEPTGDPGLDMTIAPETVTPEQAASLPPAVESQPSLEQMIQASTRPDQPAGPAYDPASDPQNDPTLGTATPDEPVTAKPGAPPAAAPSPSALSPASSPQGMTLAPERTPGAVPGIGSEIARAYKNAAAAEQAKADVAKKESAEALITQQKNEEQRQNLTASWQKTWEGWQQRGDEMRQSILDQKIDPRRYWNEKGTGGKISAAIGLILGGLGSGLTHGPNQALQVIEKAIDRDVDAQKTELGKKESLLGFHMQQGHALMASRQLAIADMKDAAAAQLQMVATKYAAPQAQASAQLAIAGLQRDAALTRQNVAAAGLQMQLHGIQIQQAQMGLARSRWEMGLLQQSLQGGKGAQPQGEPVIDQRTGQPLTRSAPVSRLLIDGGDRQKFQDAHLAARDQGEKLDAIQAFTRDHPKGAWTPADRQRAHSLMKDFQLSWNKSQEGNSRLSDTDLGVIEDMTSDPAGFWAASTGKVQAALDVARSAIARKQTAIKDTYLMPGVGPVDPRMGLLSPEWGKRIVQVHEKQPIRSQR